METERDLAGRLIEVAPMVMRVVRAYMRANRASDLSTPQFRALNFIRRHQGASLSQVAEHLGLSPAGASRLVDALVSRGYIARQVSATDRRYVMLDLLPLGADVLAETRQRAEAGIAALLVGVPADDRRGIARALETLRVIFAEAPVDEETVRATIAADAATGEHSLETLERR